MTRQTKGLAGLGLDNAIRLHWMLRDIRGNRLKLTPPSQEDLRTLIEMGYVEMRNDQPFVTSEGINEMDQGD